MSLAEPPPWWHGWGGGPIQNRTVMVADKNEGLVSAGTPLGDPGGVEGTTAAETTTVFRVSEFPTTPAQRAGTPVVEFRTGQDLLSRGWSRRLIDEHLGEPDGTRPRGRGVRRYYRVDRVLNAEQALVAAQGHNRRRDGPHELAVDPPPPSRQRRVSRSRTVRGGSDPGGSQIRCRMLRVAASPVVENS
jgi:hypothetical protein